MTQYPDNPMQQANREALKDLIEEIRHEYPDAATLTLREFDGSLDLCRLKEAGGYAYGLDDCDSLFETARSVDLSDPSWTSGLAEPVVLEDGTPGWIICLAAAAATLKLLEISAPTPAGSSTETFADRMAAQSIAALHAKYPPADPGRNENPMTTILNLDGIDFGQLTVNELIQLTVHDLATISVDLGPGVSFKTQPGGLRGERIVFFRDDVALLPRLADVQDSLLALVAPGGRKAVHRLRGSLTGVLAKDPEAKASNVIGGALWEGPLAQAEFAVPDEPIVGHPLHVVIGAVYWAEDDKVMRSNINGAGILGRKATHRPGL